MILKTFALVALLHGNAYEVDFDMSYDDCMQARQETAYLDMHDDRTGLSWIQPVTADMLTCEPDLKTAAMAVEYRAFVKTYLTQNR